MKTQTKFGKWGMMLATLMFALSTSSCKEGFIYEGEGDCGTYYNIKFKYDYNMKYADAFANEVESVSLFVFDQNDILVESVTIADEASLKAADFAIPLELESGEYELVAWAGLNNETSFDLLADVEVGKTKREELQVALKATNDKRVVEDLEPLFHGAMTLNYTAEPGTYTETMSLVKDTNVVRILLQQMSDGIVADKFRYEITADNGLLDWNNDVIANGELTYEPWSVTTGTADVAPDYGTNATRVDQVSVAIAEFTVNRMIDGQSPILTIYNLEENEPVLSIPVADYALLVKGHYNSNMSNQEYLDRQDEYNMTFFLDEDGDWLSASIIVNSWRVVLNNDTL
jgi:hypothetical protein